MITGRGLKGLEGRTRGHPPRLASAIPRLKASFSDRALVGGDPKGLAAKWGSHVPAECGEFNDALGPRCDLEGLLVIVHDLRRETVGMNRGRHGTCKHEHGVARIRRRFFSRILA